MFSSCALRNAMRRSNMASQFWFRARSSSVMKNRVMPCAELARTQALNVVGVAVARLAALDVDDRTETALERTAAAGIGPEQCPFMPVATSRGRLGVRRPPSPEGSSGNCRPASPCVGDSARSFLCGLRPRRRTEGGQFELLEVGRPFRAAWQCSRSRGSHR